MKKVSFEVARALKEAGYPQERPLSFYVLEKYKDFTIGELYNATIDWAPIEYRVNAPSYFEVWLWLWREKSIHITIDTYKEFVCAYCNNTIIIRHNEKISNDPEEAIENAIEYLVDNNLIK